MVLTGVGASRRAAAETPVSFPIRRGKTFAALPVVTPAKAPMHPLKSRAFTLIELLVVITIIAVLAGIALPVFGSVQQAARKSQSLSNMRQLGALLLSYCSDNNGNLPLQGDTAPTWSGAAANTSTETTAWYNAVPREATGGKGVGDYLNNEAAFYAGGSLFYVPGAKYPASKISGASPYFAVSYNSKLFGSFGTETISSIRLQDFTLPAKTVLFQESGLPGETMITGQKSGGYNGQASTFASRSVTRYSGETIIVFADGHGGQFTGSQIVDPATGKGYFPQISGNGQVSAGQVLWTLDPTVSPN